MDTNLMEIKELLEEEISFQKEKQERARKRQRAARRRKEKREAIFFFVAGAFSVLVIAAISVIATFFLLTEKDDVIPAIEITPIITPPATPAPVKEEYPSIHVVVENTAEKTVVNVSQKPVETEVTIVQSPNAERLFFEQILAAESYDFWTQQDLLTLATVVINRVNNPDFPDTITDVLKQDLQFETYANGRYMTAVVTEECHEAVSLALAGKTNLNSDVLWFCTKEYYENSPDDDFFKGLDHVYTCRNIYFFEK